MKLECRKAILEEALMKVVRIATKHLTLPVLSCVYLDLNEENNLTLKSTNLDLGIEIQIKVKNGEKGIVAVPGSTLLNTLSAINDNDISMQSEDGNLKIKSGRHNAVIKCMPYEDFPSIPKIQSSTAFKMNAADLVSGFKAVWYSASVSNVKPELGSVYIYQNEDCLVFVSTDSFRLAEKKIYTKNITDFLGTLIPQKNVSEIIKLLENHKEEVEILFDKNQASFTNQDVYLVSRLIDGSFPDYKQIIPKSPIASATLLKSDLQNAVKASNIFSGSLNQVKLKLNTKEKILQVEAKNNDVGEYKESIKANTEGENIELNFNNRYITDCFQSTPGESITMDFGGPGKPLVIRGASDKSFLYIAMPMNR